jgi:hypothetical protein
MAEKDIPDFPPGGKWVTPGGSEVPEDEATYYFHPDHGYKHRDPKVAIAFASYGCHFDLRVIDVSRFPRRA